MAPQLVARARCNNGYSYYDNCYSPWYDYGRWIVLAAIILGAFLIFLLFACISARRRRRQGMQPFRGTGWAGGNTAPGHGAPMYTGPPGQQPYGQQPYGHANAPPVYSPPPPQQGYGYNQYGAGNQGYFGGQQTGVELQQPNQAFQPQRGGDQVYAPPAGPPPAKA